MYPRRFENRKTNKSGYAPACGNEWVRGICEKPRIKCLDCQYRRFLPVTEEIIQWHLLGIDSSGRDFVMGVYPILLDETWLFFAEAISASLARKLGSHILTETMEKHPDVGLDSYCPTTTE